MPLQCMIFSHIMYFSVSNFDTTISLRVICENRFLFLIHFSLKMLWYIQWTGAAFIVLPSFNSGFIFSRRSRFHVSITGMMARGIFLKSSFNLIYRFLTITFLVKWEPSFSYNFTAVFYAPFLLPRRRIDERILLDHTKKNSRFEHLFQQHSEMAQMC